MSNVYVHFSLISFPARYSVVNFQLVSHSLRFREVINFNSHPAYDRMTMYGFWGNKISRLILVLKINRLCINYFSTFLNIASLNFATYSLIFLLLQNILPLYVYLHRHDTLQLTFHNYSFSAFSRLIHYLNILH